MAGAKLNLTTRRAALLATALMTGACGVADDRDADQADAGQAASEPSAVSAEDETNPDPQTIAPEDLLRSANFYRLEWDDTAGLCVIALEALNKPYALPSNMRTTPDGVEPDYASKQAMVFLGNDDNVRWRWDAVDAAGPGLSESAKLDYFNDGVERLVVRTRGRLAGNNIVGLGIAENDSGEFTRLSFGHAGAAVESLPDQDNLHTKLTYSVADVIQLGDSFYTLLMPLEDVDPSTRAYLSTWRPKEGTDAPRSPADYYAQLACIFRAASAQLPDSR